MPLHVTDYTWTQTDSAVHITVPLKGAKPGQVDIVSTDEYLKVNFPPFLFEAFLFEPVDDDRSTAKVGNGVAVFSLPKKTSRLWDNLVLSTNDKAKKKEIREKALEKHQQKLSSQSKQKAEKQQAEKKYALKTMMKIKQAQPPPPRPGGNIQISFTPRVFPTALRESRLPEEEEAEARRSVISAAEELQDLREEERNPDWLKDKGECFGTGDFQGAVNAYSLALRLNPQLPALFSNRAACHLKLRNLHKAIQDASKLYAEGLLDYEAALRIDPQNEALRADAQRIRAIIQGSAANQDAERGG
ncbi:unnamed protein product, partial [Menidia menidia]